MSITLTEKAAGKVVECIKDQNGKAGDGSAAPMYLRVGVKGGGCSGFSYSLDLTETKQETDESWNLHGVEVICDPKSLLYLNGTTVDYKESIMGSGFVFTNPNATSSCGCGSSFSA